MNAKRMLLAAVLPLIGCVPPPVRVDMTAATPQETPKAAAIEYAPGQHVALSWDEAGLRCRLWGQWSSRSDEASISIRNEDSSRVLYLTFPVMSIGAVLGVPSAPVRATKILKDRPPDTITLSKEQFRWVELIGPCKSINTYGATFHLAWSALGYSGKPAENLIVIVQKIERRPPGAIFTLNAATTTQPGGK